MRYLGKLFLLMAALFPSITLGQQQSVLDSLKRELSKTNDNPKKVDILNAIAWELKDAPGEASLDYLDQAWQLAEKIDYPAGKGDVLVRRGIYHRNHGDLNAAETAFLMAREIRKSIHDDSGVGKVDNNLGRLMYKQNNYRAAWRYYSEAFDLLFRANDSIEVANTCANIALLHKNMGNYKTSLRYGYQAILLFEATHQTSELGGAWLAVGNTHERIGQYTRAKRAYLKAFKYFETVNNQRELGYTLNNLGNVEQYDNHYTEALDYYRASSKIKASLLDTLGMVNSHLNMAQAYRELGNFTVAKDHLGIANTLLLHRNAPREQCAVQNMLAELLLWEGQPQSAQVLLQQLKPQIDSLHDPILQAELCDLLCVTNVGLHQWEEAANWNHQAHLLRHQIEMQTYAAEYENDAYGDLAISKLNLDLKILASEKRLSDERTKYERLAFLAILLLLTIAFLLIFGFQRLRMIESKRKAELAQHHLREKANEIERILQDQELKSLQMIVETENKERQRIALDLHDRVGGQLASFNLVFSQFRDEALVATPSLQPQYGKLSTALDELMKEVRAVSHNLESPTLRDFGLVAALEGIRDTISHATDIDFELIIHGLEQRLTFQTEMHIFLILKELLNNAIRRGEATEISMQLLRDQQTLRMIVEDNGKGFNRHSTDFKAGLGLQSIDNRVKAMTGHWSIDSVVGRGSIFTFEIPITYVHE